MPLGSVDTIDLVDGPATDRVSHCSDRVSVADLAVGIGAHLAKAGEDVVESSPCHVQRRLLVPRQPTADRSQRHDDIGLDRSFRESSPDRVCVSDSLVRV